LAANKKDINLRLVICFIFLTSAIFCKNLLVADVYCEADGGTHHSILTFPNKTISATQNKSGQTFEQHVDNGNRYHGFCYCTSNFNYVYYTAVENSSLAKSGVRSNIQYYNLNEHLDVGISIAILGRGYINVPFSNQPNNPDGKNTCTDNKKIATFDSGSDAIIYFYVKEPFIGKVTIPTMLMASLYGKTNATGADSPTPLADVYIQGDITAPQECEVNGGQVIEVNFEKIPASEFSSTPGSAITSRKIPIKASVKCTGMAAGQDVEVSLHATQTAASPTMLQTSNDDVGIKIYDEYDKEVDVNGGRMETDMGKRSRLGEEDGEFNFSAAPGSATGARPKPGTFNANATIIMEIKN
jgi:type 1 fimbria pilin